MTQPELGREADMKQSRISAIERPGSANLNVDTLIRVAAALRVGLKVELVPFSEMLRWENNFSQDGFSLPKIEEDTAFINPRRARRRGNQHSLAGVCGCRIQRGAC